MIAWLLALALADDAKLAPTFDDLDVALDRTLVLVIQAEAHLEVMSDAQSGWVARACTANKCPWKVGAELVATARKAGHEARDVVQSARAQLERAQTIADSPLLAPLLDDVQRDRVVYVERETEALVKAYLVRTAWYKRYMSGWAWKYKWAVEDRCAPDYRGPE